MNDDIPPVDDSIDAGKRLVRLRSNVGQSLGERLTNHFYRLTWRTPLHALRLRGRYPLKLLTVPDDPIAGDAVRGRALIAGQIVWRSESIKVADYDFAVATAAPGLDIHMQSFVWLRDLAAGGARAEGAPVAEALTRRWLERHGALVSDTAWRGDLWGKRILYWAAHAPLILSSTDLVYRSAVLNALARGARHLDRVADRMPLGIGRIAAWCGIVAAGLLIPGGDPRRSFGEAGLARALAGNFTNDGGSLCRSPLNQMEAVTLLSMLRAVYVARKAAPPDFLETALNIAVPPLLGATMGDGGLANWQGGSATGEAVNAVVAGSGVRARPLRQARDWGYQRVQSGQTIVIVDGAPPPTSQIATAGCASTLAIELSDGVHRIVVNCGGARMVGTPVPPALAEGLRTTAAHSTLILSDSNSTAIHADGSLGRGVTEVELDRTDTEIGSRIEASHDGYGKRYGLLHSRSVAVSPDGREVRGEDVLRPARANRKPQAAHFAARFHLGPAVEVSPTADGMGALLRISEGALWQFRCHGGALQIDESVWVDGNGRPHNTKQLVVTGDTPPGGASISWAFRRAG
jgi:uncharacterized heparinase superfamily protein